MTRSVPVTEASLRRAMRDARYWNNASLERPGYVRWVTEGYRALAGPTIRLPDGGGMVFVRAYTRSRDGKTEQVRAHYRADPPGGKDRGGEGGTGTGKRAGSPPAGKASSPEDDGTTLPASWWLLPRGPIIGARPPVIPRLPGQRLPEGMRDPGGVPLPRAAGRSGKEAATDTPGWAREFRDIRQKPPGSTPNAFWIGDMADGGTGIAAKTVGRPPNSAGSKRTVDADSTHAQCRDRRRRRSTDDAATCLDTSAL